MKAIAAVAVLALSACAYKPEPVPVYGAMADLQALAGEWEGEYWTERGGTRAGSILFRLTAGRDTARGDVLMTPEGAAYGPAQPGAQTQQRTPQLLTISFVRAEQGRVSGVLEPYRDPECGCTLRSEFTGRLTGDAIEGTFTSLHVNTGEVRSGRWRASRRHR